MSKSKGRAFLKAAGFLVVGALLVGFLVHTSAAKNAVRRFLVTSLEGRLGGSASVDRLEYRLWLGEVRAMGVQWTAANESISIRLEELYATLRLGSGTLVRLQSPEVRFRDRGGETVAEDSPGVRLPAWLFAVAVTMTDGRILADDIEAEGVDVRVDPVDGSWEGRLTTRRVVLPWSEDAVDIDSAEARFRMGPTSAEVTESRIEMGTSRVTGTVRIDSYSPVVARANLNHVVDGTLVRQLLPSVNVDGTIHGEAAIQLDEDSLRADGVFEARGVAYTPLEPVEARVPWRLEDDVLEVADAELRGYGGRAVVSARLDTAANTQQLEASFEDIETQSGIASRLRGSASVTLERWAPESARGQANVELRAVPALAGVPLQGMVQLDIDGPELAVRAPRLTGPGFEAEVSGTVGETLSLDYEARAENLAELSFIPANLGVTGSGIIEGRIDGPLRDPRATASLTTSELAITGEPLELTADLAWAGSRLELPALSLRHPSGGALSVRGGFDLQSRTLSLRGEGDDFTFQELPEIEANISSIRVEVEGPIDSLTGMAGARLEELRFREVSLPGTTVVIEADGSGARLVATADSEPVLSARFDNRRPYPLEAVLRLDDLPLGELLRTLPDFENTALQLDGRLLVSGALAEPESFHYRLEADEAAGMYRGVGFGVGAPFVIEGDRDVLTVHDLTLVGADTTIDVDGSVPLDSTGALDLRARGVVRLEFFNVWLPDVNLEGGADLEIQASGTVADPELYGYLEIAETRAVVEPLGVDGVEGRAQFRGTMVSVENVTGEILGGRFRIDGELPWRGEAERTWSFRLDDIEPSALLDSDMVQVRLSASGDVTVPATDFPSWRADGRIESVRASLGRVTVSSEEAASWNLADGQVQLSDLHLVGDGTDLVLVGQTSPLAEPFDWSSRVSGRVDTGFLAPALAELGVALTGVAEVDVRASQSLENFNLDGTLSIRDGRFSVRDPAMAFTNLSADLELRGQTIQLVRLDANAVGGSVRADGEIQLSGTSVTGIDLRGQARSLRLSYPEGVRSEIDGTIRLAGTLSDLALTGDIELARAIFSRNISLQTELLQSLSRARTFTPPDSTAERVRLDIRVRSRGIRVDNNLASMDASTNLTIRGSLAEPELTGSIAVREGGEFRFGRNTYRIESGQILLERYPVEPPQLFIQARTTVSEYDIQLSVTGSADDLTTNLSGTSRRDGRPISRADAASLLVTGRTIDKISTEGRTILGEQMASYLGQSLADLAQFSLGRALPFNIVTVEPALIAREADPAARFTLGAGLSESLSVVYSIGLNDAEKQIWIVDYELPRNTRAQVIRQEDTEFTFAFGQQLQFDRSEVQNSSTPRIEVASVDFYFVTGEPEELEVEARERLRIEVGQRYDYWRAWERIQELRAWLRDRGFLEATADLNATPCGSGCVDLDVHVLTGKPVRFVWRGDEVLDSMKESLAEAWDGYMTLEFLASDLESRAEAMLFEQRYYLADVRANAVDTVEETIVTVDVARGPRGERVVVELEGNETASDETLRTALPRGSTAEFHALITSKQPRLKQILEIQYASRGFLDPEIGDPVTSFDEETNVLRVTIPIVEGERAVVDRIEIEGVERLPEASVRSRLSLREKSPFRLSDFVQDRSAIAALYRREGFTDVEVSSSVLPGDAPGLLVARYVVREGPQVTVGNIRVVGNDDTRESVIRREVALEPGEPLRLSQISATQKRLYELGVFRSADITVGELDGEDTTAVRDVMIEVVEVPDVTLDYGVRYATDGLFQVVADVGAPNVLGRAQRIGFRTLLGSDQQIFRLTYRAPYVARYKVSTDFFLERKLEEEVPEGTTSPIRDRTWSFTAQQRRALGDKLGLQWSYSFRRVTTEFEGLGFSPLAFNQSVINAALIGDYRDNVVSPSRGSLWSINAQYAPEIFEAAAKFVKFFGQAYTFVPLGGGVVWASGYRFGVTNDFGDRLLEDDRFQAGGPSSVRGFAQGTLGPVDPVLEIPIGGAGTLIMNQEIRFPIFWRLRGVGFYDTGNVFEQPSDIRLSDLRHSLGVGLRVELPFGLFRFDWARVLDPRDGDDLSRFVFSLGHAF